MMEFKIFKQYPNLLHFITTKDEGNFTLKKEDLQMRDDIRHQLAVKYEFKRGNLYEMEQVHGNNIKILRNDDIKKLRNNFIKNCDGLITDIHNVFLMIRTADCYPVILYDPHKKVLAAIHAGRNGAQKGILTRAVNQMEKLFYCQPKHILVGIGPGIGKCCYKYKYFTQEQNKAWSEFISNDTNGQSLDLQGYIIKQLILSGIRKNNVEMIDICTCCSKDFFSHYRAQKTGEPEGRFATIVGMKD